MTTEDVQGQLGRSAAVERELREQLAGLKAALAKSEREVAHMDEAYAACVTDRRARVAAAIACAKKAERERDEVIRGAEKGVKIIMDADKRLAAATARIAELERDKASLTDAFTGLRQTYGLVLAFAREVFGVLERGEDGHEMTVPKRTVDLLRCKDAIPTAADALADAIPRAALAPNAPPPRLTDAQLLGDPAQGVTSRAEGEPPGPGCYCQPAKTPAQEPEQGEARGAGKVHRCMRCGGEFACRTAGCEAKYDVLPRIVQRAPDGSVEVVEHECAAKAAPAQAEPDALREARDALREAFLFISGKAPLSEPVLKQIDRASALIDLALAPPAPDTAPRSGIPLLDHAFVPTAWPAVDACDARVSDPGSQISRQCGRPRKEHPEEEGAK